ncbi:MAG: molybdopterin-dependent oxidoreductase [Acidobacteriia bacterium]|nr:molybdopterin-dependent oxidoreductase [Terriglobia bacterium]
MKRERRQFLKGLVGGSVALGLGFSGLRFLEALPAEGAVPAAEKIFRTGHNTNCDGACGHQVHVVDGRVTFIEGAGWETNIDGRAAQTFNPRICLRGLSQIQNTYSPDRIKYPYRRVGPRGSGQFERITWDQATSAIAENFQKIQTQFGRESVWIAPYTGALSLLEGVIGASFRFASVIGASAGDFEGDNEGDSAGPAAFNYMLYDPTAPANSGGLLDGHEYTDLLNAKVIFLWGNNLAETSIPDWRTVCDARNNGTKVISLDPRYTPTAAGADLWVPVRPGTDTALIDGMMNWIIQNKRYDEAYLLKYSVAPFLVHPKTKLFLKHKDLVPGGANKYVVFDERDRTIKRYDDPTLTRASLLGTHSFGGLQASTAMQVLADTMSKFTPEYAAKITDVAPETVVHLAQLYAGNHPAAIKCGFGLSHWHRGDLTHQALLTMATLTGNIGVQGGGVTIMSGALLSNAFSGLGNFWNPDGKKWVPLQPMAACDAMLFGKPYPVRAAWFMIDNYAQQMADRNKVLKALKSLDFLVVSDYVLSATAELADIVLPACTYLEKTDLLGSFNYYLQYMPKVIEPMWESKSDLDAFGLVAQKMGVGQYFQKKPDDYIKDVLAIGDPKAPESVRGLTWEQLTSGAYRLNLPAPYVPYADKKFATKSGRIEFYVESLLPYDQEVCDYKEPIEASPNNPLYQKYPLVFLSTHTRFRTHSQYANLPWLKEINNNGEGFLEINPTDARARGIASGHVVRIFNDRGWMKVRARLTEAIKPGVVNCYQGGWVTRQVKHYIEGHPNNLTHQIANPAQSIVPNFPSNAAYYDCLVQVEKAEG